MKMSALYRQVNPVSVVGSTDPQKNGGVAFCYYGLKSRCPLIKICKVEVRGGESL